MGKASLLRALKLLHRAKAEDKTYTELAREDGCSNENYRQLLTNNNLRERYKEHKNSLLKKKENAAIQKRIDNLLERKVGKPTLDSKIRARQLLNRCVKLNMTISRLAINDGHTPANYINMLDRAGIHEEYIKKLRNNNCRQSPEVAKRGAAIFERCKAQGLSYKELAGLEDEDATRYHDAIIRARLRKEYDKWRIDFKVARLKSKMGKKK